jgi:hypothetical protein
VSTIRLLENGRWSKPPKIMAARRILTDALLTDWETAQLGDMAEFVNGTSYDATQLSGRGLPIIRISNITDPTSDFLVTPQEFEPKFIVEPGDLLVSWSASFKTIIWPGPRGVLNQHIFRVIERDENDRRFLRHLIEAVFDEMQENVVGIGMMHLRRKAFLEQVVPFPDIATQRTVADYLDRIESGGDTGDLVLPVELHGPSAVVGNVSALIDRIEAARSLVVELAEMVPAVVRLAEGLFPPAAAD